MANLVLKDIDPVLNERLLRLGLTQRWNSRDTIMRVLEQGLEYFDAQRRAAEAPAAPSVTTGGSVVAPAPASEKDMLAEAIAALENVPPARV